MSAKRTPVSRIWPVLASFVINSRAGARVRRCHMSARLFFLARFFAMNLTNLVDEMTLIAIEQPRTKSANAAACS
jgi:hypothetical protein